MGLYDFDTPPAAVIDTPAAEPVAVEESPPAVEGPPWATIFDAPTMRCSDCYNVRYEPECRTDGDGKAVWSNTDAWCGERGVQIDGAEVERRCLDGDPKPGKGVFG